MDSKRLRSRFSVSSGFPAAHIFPHWLTDKLSKIQTKSKRPRRKLIIALSIGIPVVATLIATAVYTYNFNATTNLSYGFAATTNCSNTTILFPGMYSYESRSDDFSVRPAEMVTFLGRDIAAKQVCIDTNNEPRASSKYSFAITSSVLGFISKDISMISQKQPAVATAPTDGKTVPIAGEIEFTLDKPSTVFNYRISANGNDSDCAYGTDTESLMCKTAPLELEQSKQYSFVLKRSFADFEDESSIFTGVYKTAEAVTVAESTIEDEQLFYSKPQEVTITFNKPVSSLGAVQLSRKDNGTVIPTTVQLDDSDITITFEEELDRDTEFELRLESAEAEDKGWMQKPYVISFFTSGGPKVIGHNLDGHSFNQTANITLNLDSALDSSEDITNLISLTSGGEALAFSHTANGSTITINPAQTLGVCQAIKVSVKTGLVSSYGVVSDSSFNGSARTSCYTTELVGYSEKGRGIYAYIFGTGSERVMFTGATHGDEPSSKYILDSLISDLNASYNNIPSAKQVIVVPNINPDGISAGTRTNSAGIDLNRNFPANNWKEDVVMPDGSLNEGGGGEEPLDQPESAAIANYTLAKAPSLVVNYHATGGLSISNGSGNSVSRAKTYASYVGYTYMTSQASNSVFSHDTTGAYSDWLHDKAGIPAVLIELWSYSGNEFGTHKSAMWEMIRS